MRETGVAFIDGGWLKEDYGRGMLSISQIGETEAEILAKHSGQANHLGARRLLARTEAAKHGILQHRTCPTTNDYRDHQAAQGIIDENEVGGLYQQIRLKDFQPMVWESVLEELVMWHGAPMAAVTRAFGALGV
ncbi:hypothetical protein SI65_04993 [Aspergillus cristatus]|uniref:Uncharacterized protein n=1 Tax=Aspergillus cristatus TaxID=573508 RepID=A0A1E3BGG6_ASPCR|nr:hypothetical protein SI65_04993 [Aspergillus cristatus]